LADCFQEVLENLSEFKELKNKKDEMEVRILIHQSMAGAIIGRGGEKIKELREQTDSNLKVFPDCAPMSTDRVLMISAMPDKLPGIVKQLVDFMKDIQIKGPTKPYDATNYDPRAANYGGFQGSGSSFNGGPPQRGGRGGNVDPFEGGGGGRNSFDNHRQTSYGSQNSYGSQPGGGYGGDYGGRQPYSGGGGQSSYPSGGNLYNGGSRSGPPQLGSASAGFMTEVTTTQVTIPDELAGTIIGKGGERINRIRQDSGARIDVGTNNYGSNERIITITGTSHQIQSAQYHLQQSVRTSEAGRRYLSQQQR